MIQPVLLYIFKYLAKVLIIAFDKIANFAIDKKLEWFRQKRVLATLIARRYKIYLDVKETNKNYLRWDQFFDDDDDDWMSLLLIVTAWRLIYYIFWWARYYILNVGDFIHEYISIWEYLYNLICNTYLFLVFLFRFIIRGFFYIPKNSGYHNFTVHTVPIFRHHNYLKLKRVKSKFSFFKSLNMKYKNNSSMFFTKKRRNNWKLNKFLVKIAKHKTNLRRKKKMRDIKGRKKRLKIKVKRIKKWKKRFWIDKYRFFIKKYKRSYNTWRLSCRRRRRDRFFRVTKLRQKVPLKKISDY